MIRNDYSDSDARKQIFKNTKTNLFVEASAGSGKTTSLVNRMVALVEEGVPVNQICTITFTIAAADEFFERFQRLLSRRTIDDPNDPSIKDLGPTDETTRARCQEALNNIDACFSGTMDSFCNMVAHELPIELDIPSDAVVIPDSEKSSIIKEEYFKILTNNKHPLHDQAVLFNKTFRKGAFDAFLAGMNEIFDYRDYEIVFDKDLLSDSSDHIIDAELNDIYNLLVEIEKDGLVNITDGKKAEKAKVAVDRKFRLKGNWKENAQNISYIMGRFDAATLFAPAVQGTTLETNFLEPAKSSKFKYTQAILDEISRVETIVDEYCFQVYFSFISEAIKEVTEHMKAESKFTFFDFLYCLTKRFKEDSATKDREIVSHVYDRHNHILIDESQDTNPMQTHLFFYLTGLVSTDNWELVNPRPGSLFIVGDPKQSIYRFRGADVEAYNHTKDVFANIGDVIFLSKNFRSNIVVKEYFNKEMNRVLDIGTRPLTHKNIPLIPETQREKDRANKEADPKITLDQGVYQYLTSRNRNEDAKIVAELVEKIVNNDNYQIISQKSDKVRKIDYKDILVITIDKKISEYVAEFANHNIPLRVEAKIYFSNSPAVDILKKLTCLLFEPYQTRYFVDVVRSDLYKLNPSDIITMKKDGFSLDISKLTDKDDNPVVFSNPDHERIIKELNELYLDTKGLSISSTLFYLLSNKKFDFFKNISPKFIDHAYYVVELVKAAEKDGRIVSFDDAKYFLEHSINDNSDVEKIMKFSDEINQVKISNLHKVKGLQAPVVILSGANATQHPEKKYVDPINKKLYFKEISYKNKKGGDEIVCSSNKYDSQINISQLESDSEDRRIEYVAATRAESVLIIGRQYNPTDKSINPWADLLTPYLQEIPDYPSQPASPVIEQYDDVIKGYKSIVNDACNDKSYNVQNPSGLRIKSKITNIDTVVEQEEVDDDIDKAQLGTIIHRLLECIVTSKNQFDITELAISIVNEYGFDDVTSQKYINTATKVGNIFVAGGFAQTSNNIPQDLFNVLMHAKDVMCELPFAYRSGDTIVSGTIDLLYEDESGWHVIDYKTNMEGDISTLETKYKGQLDVYKKAVKQALGVDCDAHIYHIETVNI